MELISRRTHQFLQQSGFEWKTAYRMLDEQDTHNRELAINEINSIHAMNERHHAAPLGPARMDMEQIVNERRIQSLEKKGGERECNCWNLQLWA
ncbi:hypothetical protein [Paenibacillus kribbensis]|uniref:hypothetical protein n=1 Tax=Paenibacillus kribbensis TaxID=172713 RepID=UPI00083836D3|nr:hypothetical protein [Paenibacillus kribbensis]